MNLEFPLDVWHALTEQPKTIFGWPDWQEGKLWRESKKDAQAAGRVPFHSQEANRLSLNILLDDGSGAAIEGAQIRIMVWKHRLMHDITATLEATHEMKPICISRIDVAPTLPHANKHWKRFKCPADISGSHYHPCYENALIGREAFFPIGNLPLALPIDPEPQSYRDFLRVVGTIFKVDGLEDLTPPPVEESMI